MKKQVLGLMLSAILAVSLCACGTQGEISTGSTDLTGEDTADPYELSSGDVELTVWAEEDNFEMMEQMIESFKAGYNVCLSLYRR